MHEQSLVRTLLNQVHEICIERHIPRVDGIRIGIGEFSGVEADLMQTAYEELSVDYFDVPVRLDIDRIPLRGTCRGCQETFEIEGFSFICPDCGGTSVQIVSGDELKLISLSIHDEPAYDRQGSDPELNQTEYWR